AAMTTVTRRADPLTFELIKNGLSVLCDEMALTMAAAPCSLIVRESLDFTTALLTADGEVMAQGQTNALHLGSIMAALAGIRARFATLCSPGTCSSTTIRTRAAATCQTCSSLSR